MEIRRSAFHVIDEAGDDTLLRTIERLDRPCELGSRGRAGTIEIFDMQGEPICMLSDGTLRGVDTGRRFRIAN